MLRPTHLPTSNALSGCGRQPPPPVVWWRARISAAGGAYLPREHLTGLHVVTASTTPYDVHLTSTQFARRSFILGNKRAMTLSLPAASGASDSLLHPHKWFGAYLYGRKFVEAQLVYACRERDVLLSRRNQTGLTVGLTTARRNFVVEGHWCSEAYFVPDNIPAFACTISGGLDFVVVPEFDMRFYRALSDSLNDYRVEEIAGGRVISNALPSGTYDDQTETFRPDGTHLPARIYAAVGAIGDRIWMSDVPGERRERRKIFRSDADRRRFLEQSAAYSTDGDHAPLWNQSTSRVFAPIRLHVGREGTVVYGFGGSKSEAVQHMEELRDSLSIHLKRKEDATVQSLSHTGFETGNSRVDTAVTQVFVRLMDSLVVRRAVAEDTALAGPATMILAGNQYFHDSWKRDENIALGFLLTLGFYDLAREVIRDSWQLQDTVSGRLPQRIRAGESPPYHSSDGTLWAAWRLYQYWRCTGDDSLLREKLSMVEHFLEASMPRTVDGLLPSGKTTSPDYLWETWMDTPHTPRDGFPVEIQMLWIACLRAWRPLIASHNGDLAARVARVEEAATRALRRYNLRGMPADSLDAQGAVRDFITPNPYLAFGLGIDLGSRVELTMRAIGRSQLAGRQGIATLAPADWDRVFPRSFLDDRRNVRGKRMNSAGKYNYHRGVEWNWLSQFFVLAELKFGNADRAYDTYFKKQVNGVLDLAGIGGMSELHDLSGARGPDFQAWSMSGFLEAAHAFAGVQIDVPDRRICIRPQIPRSWPYLRVRKWFGSVPFDLEYTARAGERRLRVDFPEGSPAETQLEIALLVPARNTVERVSLQCNDCPQRPDYRREVVPGTRSERVCLTVPASSAVEVVTSLGDSCWWPGPHRRVNVGRRAAPCAPL